MEGCKMNAGIEYSAQRKQWAICIHPAGCGEYYKAYLGNGMAPVQGYEQACLDLEAKGPPERK